ncbi:hypothetical protein JZ751_017484 [Albula glossodonta]|uniref:BEN domain-containing protein n=1 Tax=Albula glossodonta TaxID=121402 RepID=A0A8T2PNV2_9TELE|nr:hypothetical protein JZ751_017484 [Albula glossodonta]
MSNNMIKFQVLNAYFTERLMLAVQDIMKVVGDTLSEYQEETDRTKRENEKLRRRLREVGLHADPGFPTDLAKIKIEDGEWLTKYGEVRDEDGYSTEEPKKKKVKTKHIDGELLLDCDHTQDAQELLMQIEDLQERLKDAETQEGEISGYLSPMAVKISQRCSNYKKLTRTLLCAMFTEQQLISCSVTGKKGVNAEIKESLDIDKVNMIIECSEPVAPPLSVNRAVTEQQELSCTLRQDIQPTVTAVKVEFTEQHSVRQGEEELTGPQPTSPGPAFPSPCAKRECEQDSLNKSMPPYRKSDCSLDFLAHPDLKMQIVNTEEMEPLPTVLCRVKKETDGLDYSSSNTPTKSLSLSVYNPSNEDCDNSGSMALQVHSIQNGINL